MKSVRYRVVIRGSVQGVGFRPFVWRLAEAHHCSGWIRNDHQGVTVEAQGSPKRVDEFIRGLQSNPPPLAVIQAFHFAPIAVVVSETCFRILDSQPVGPIAAQVAPDSAVCSDCLRELTDPSDRRYGYAFTNCTNCGPRFTIQRSLPYDRANTTMSEFTMCSECLAEYRAPTSRRFHAQPNCCSRCGPTIWFIDSQSRRRVEPESSGQVIDTVRAAIHAGQIVAIKGIGGFHLACNAKDIEACRRLRKRKHRTQRPFAVMVADLETAAGIVRLTQAESKVLESRERPIVLLRKCAATLPDSIAPGNAYLGIMLPYSPLHHLLLRSGDVWVMTSANLADEPIAFDNESAYDRLAQVADGFLMHDRPIQIACDDSVMKSCGNAVDMPKFIPIRRSRGFAPHTINLKRTGKPVLAVGGELKAAVCFAVGDDLIIGQHLGDVGSRETIEALDRSIDHLLDMYQTKPQVIACDQHPGYVSVDWARRRAAELNIPLMQIQHHHAHAASLIAEHDMEPDCRILSVVFDGTGYGSDGAIWGGEILLADCRSFRRLAHLNYLPLPGGDSCIRTPAKTALAYLRAIGLPWLDELPCVRHLSKNARRALGIQLDRKLGTIQTSSMGRLFDAVAAMIGVCEDVDYEGQAGIELESLAAAALEPNDDIGSYPFSWSTGGTPGLQLEILLKGVFDDILAGVPGELIAARFHLTIVNAVTSICKQLRKHSNHNSAAADLNTVGLTGGVFQNVVLLERMRASLMELGFNVLVHQVVPPNDGGLSLGQAVIARIKSLSETGADSLGASRDLRDFVASPERVRPLFG